MKQLFLFTTAAEDTRRLREEYDILCAYYRDLEAQHAHVEARLENAKEEFRKLRAELKAVQRERDVAKHEAEFWREVVDRRAAARPPMREQVPFLDAVLKHLIRIAHPDKWSQHQPATELAHEVVVALNEARAQLEAQL